MSTSAALFAAGIAAAIAVRVRKTQRAAQPKPKLAYWAIRGLAQSSRIVAHYSGLDYEEVLYEQGDAPDFDKSCWFDVKNELGLDFPNLPYYEEPLADGSVLRLTQSKAILRHIGRKANLLGRSAAERARVDMLLDTESDLRSGLVRLGYGRLYSDELGDDWAAKSAKFAAEFLPGHLGRFEAWMGGDDWAAKGAGPTVADFQLYEVLDQALICCPGCLDGYPKLAALVARVEALPAVNAYISSPGYMKRPLNNKHAQFR